MDSSGLWDEHLSLVEFASNNSNQVSIGIASIRALYGKMYRSPTCWFEGELLSRVGQEMLQDFQRVIETIY